MIVYDEFVVINSDADLVQARRRQLASHETLKDLAHPSELYAVSIFHLTTFLPRLLNVFATSLS